MSTFASIVLIELKNPQHILMRVFGNSALLTSVLVNKPFLHLGRGLSNNKNGEASRGIYVASIRDSCLVTGCLQEIVKQSSLI